MTRHATSTKAPSLPLEIPPDIREGRRISAGTENRYYFERYLSQWLMMEQILWVSGFHGGRHVIDFGCFVGGWSWVLSRMCEAVTALDVDDTALALGKRFAQHHGFSNLEMKTIAPDVLAALPPADGILCVGTFQVMPAADLYAFFSMVRRTLVPGGLLLCNSARMFLPLEWLLTCERVKVRGWREQLVWARAVLRALRSRRIQATGSYYCLRPFTLINLAHEHGLTLTHSPAWYRGIEATRDLERSKSGKSRPLFRHYDWYLFEKRKEAI